MTWIYHVKAPQHWVSSSPPGFFIIQEEGQNGGSLYVVYKGRFADWPEAEAEDSQLERIGRCTTLRDAKKRAEYQALET